MKKWIDIIIVILVVAVLTWPLSAQKDPKTLKFTDIEFKPLEPGNTLIQKGIDFYYQADHETPTVGMMVIFKTGSLTDPEGKTGLTELAFRLMKSGGTSHLPANQIEEQLDFLGSYIEAGAGAEYSFVNMSTLSKNFDKTWNILLDIMNNPVYSPERVDLEKKKELEDIRRRWDQPMDAGMYLFQELIFGRNFPDTRRTSVKSIESITPEDLKSFYQNHIRNREVIITAVGDIDASSLETRIRNSFSDWPGLLTETPDLPKAKLNAKPGIYLIDKPEMTQAVICLGHLGINRLDSDNVEVEILNFILGTGSFNSRMMREIRSNRGLAYAAFGMVGSGRDVGTLFTFSMTKSESTAEVINLIRGILIDMIQNPVKPEELTTAKKYTQNSFLHRFDSAQAILRQKLFNKLEGYPNDYLTTYLERIKAVDAAKVQQMAKRMLHSDQLVTLVVGRKSELLEQLKKLGEVTELALPED